MVEGHHTISAPLSFTAATVDTQDGASLTLTQNGFVGGTLTKTGGGSLIIGDGVVFTGDLNHNAGVLQVGPDVLAVRGGNVTLLDNTILILAGTINRRIIGGPLSTVQLSGSADIGVLSSTDGWAYQGALEIGDNMLGLKDADGAELYGGVMLEGGTLSSFNGIEVQPGIPGPTQAATQIRGYGVIDNAVHFDNSVVWADAANGGITFPGIVSGNPRLLRNIVLTGLNRLGASAAQTPISGRFEGGTVTTRVIYGSNSWTFDPVAWVGVGGEYDAFIATDPMILDGKLNVLLDEYEPTSSDSFAMFESLEYEDWNMYGHYEGWFSEVNLPGSMADDWFWKFTYTDLSTSMGAAPEPGRNFLMATLLVPEPGTLVLLISGGLGLLLLVWRRKRS